MHAVVTWGRRSFASPILSFLLGCLPASAAESQPPEPSTPRLVEPTLDGPTTPPQPVKSVDHPLVSADPRTYAEDKIVAMVKDHLATNGNYRMSVVPMTRELAIASAYPKWAEKRYDDATMIELARAEEGLFADTMYAVLTVVFVGDVLSGGKQLELPEDLADYLFLENDRGEAIRCSRATLPFMRLVGPFSEQANVELQFDGLRRNPDFLRTKTLKFVIGGLSFAENEIVYDYPFTELFADAPPPLPRLYRDAGVWPR